MGRTDRKPIVGGCLCGAIKYEIKASIPFARHCHCSSCRKVTGAAFGTWAYVETSNFRWVQGETKLGVYQSSPEVARTFCRVCGSTLQYMTKQASQGAFGLALGTVEGDPFVRPTRHVMVDSKAPWFEITDNLPQSKKMAPNE